MDARLPRGHSARVTGQETGLGASRPHSSRCWGLRFSDRCKLTHKQADLRLRKGVDCLRRVFNLLACKEPFGGSPHCNYPKGCIPRSGPLRSVTNPGVADAGAL
jgi:hypothetical protein